MNENDKKVVMTILSTYQWLHNQLQTTKLSILRLKKLFGYSTEKNPTTKKASNDGTQTNNNANTQEDEEKTPSKK